MKPLLRAVLIADAVLYLGAGVVLLLTPLRAIYGMLPLVAIEPAMAGQLFGLALVALAWFALRGAAHGASTIGVARAIGHLTWVAGVFVLIWALAFHSLWMPAFGVVINVIAAIGLVIVGLAGARLAAATRRRECALEAERAQAKRGVPVGAVPAPVEPVLRPAEPADAGPGAMARPADASPARAMGGDDAAGVPRPPFHG